MRDNVSFTANEEKVSITASKSADKPSSDGALTDRSNKGPGGLVRVYADPTGTDRVTPGKQCLFV
jgi:hypothetical protein